MKKENFSTTTFTIINKELFLRSLNPKEARIYAIGKASVVAITSMESRIVQRDSVAKAQVQLNINTGESSIRKNIAKSMLTQQNLQSILCLLLHDFEVAHKYYQPYTVESIKGVINSLELAYNNQGSVIVFRDFFARLDIPKNFPSGFEITTNEHWKFCLSDDKTEQDAEENVNNDEKSDESNNEEKIVEYEKGKSEKKESLNKKRISTIYVVSFLLIITSILFIFLWSTNVIKNNEGDSLQSFDEVMLGNGITTIYNKSFDGNCKKILGNSSKTFGVVGDTILVSVLVATQSEEYIKNVKVRINNSTTDNVVHKFIGNLTGFKTKSAVDSAKLYSPKKTRLKNLNQSSYQINNALSEDYFLTRNQNKELFNRGYKLGDLFPGSDNYVCLTTTYVIEPFSDDEENKFEKNPYGNNLGHTFIQLNSLSDSIYLDIPKYLDVQEFDLITEFINSSSETLIDVQALIDYDELANHRIPSLPIISKLSSYQKYHSVDVAYLLNLPDKWTLELKRIETVNYPKKGCDSLNYEYRSESNIPIKSGIQILLPDLTPEIGNDTIPCSSGYIKARFRIINTDLST